MSVKNSEAFKKQAVQKALRRSPDVTLESLCKECMGGQEVDGNRPYK